jgi:hypothetical protein
MIKIVSLVFNNIRKLMFHYFRVDSYDIIKLDFDVKFCHLLRSTCVLNDIRLTVKD